MIVVSMTLYRAFQKYADVFKIRALNMLNLKYNVSIVIDLNFMYSSFRLYIFFKCQLDQYKSA